jgi:hypothetical protein
MIEESGSIHRTNGSGSRRPKNIRIRRIQNTGPPPPHFLTQMSICAMARCPSATARWRGVRASLSQRHGSADPDPDPHQNVMDPQHCYQHVCTLWFSISICHSYPDEYLCDGEVSQRGGKVEGGARVPAAHHSVHLLLAAMRQRQRHANHVRPVQTERVKARGRERIKKNINKGVTSKSLLLVWRILNHEQGFG